MATWPESLPQDLLEAGYNEKFPETTIRSNMDVGPAKVRQRISYNYTPIDGKLLLNTTEVATLYTFFAETLLGGSLPFSWSHPRTNASANFRFVSPPVVTARETNWEVQLDLEIMP